MSKERQRARAVREAAAAAEKEKAAKARARAERRTKLVPALPTVPRRRRRYGALPVRVLLALFTGWLAFQVLVTQLTPDLRARIGLALLSLAALPLVVVLTRSPR